MPFGKISLNLLKLYIIRPRFFKREVVQMIFHPTIMQKCTAIMSIFVCQYNHLLAELLPGQLLETVLRKDVL